MATAKKPDLPDILALVVDSNPTSRTLLVGQLRDYGATKVVQCSRVQDARNRLEHTVFDYVLCDQYFPGVQCSGQTLLDDLRRVYAGLFASRGESPYMIGLPRCEIVPCHFSSEANQVGALYTYLQAESKTI